MGSEEEKPETFEEVLGALEAQVARLERGDLPLEEALAAFEQGMALAERGEARLAAAEQKVEQLLAVRDGEAVARPLDVE